MWEWIIVIVVVKIIVLAAVSLACFIRRRKENVRMVNVQIESGEAYEIPVESATSKGYVGFKSYEFQESSLLLNPETGWASASGRF